MKFLSCQCNEVAKRERKVIKKSDINKTFTFGFQLFNFFSLSLFAFCFSLKTFNFSITFPLGMYQSLHVKVCYVPQGSIG